MTDKPVGEARYHLEGDRATELPRDSDTDRAESDFTEWLDAAERLDDLPLSFARTRSAYTPDFWPAREATPTRDETERTWHHLMPAPESEWDAERRHQQAILKLLPRRVRRAVTRVRSTYLRGAVLDLATNELLRRAAKHDRLLETHAADEILEVLRAPLGYVPAPDAEKLAREMGQDNAFMLRLFKTAKASARRARMLNTWSSRSFPSDLPRIRIPRSRTLQVEAWIGLTETPLQHRPPEGLLVAIAQRCVAANGRRTAWPLNVLDWGAGNSPFTMALLGVKASKGKGEASLSERCGWRHTKEWLCVDEVDTLGDAPPDLPFVRRTHAVWREKIYDYVVLQLPPPCATRGGYRDRFKELPAGKTGQVRLRDLGRLGAHRWAKSAPRVVQSVLAATATGSEKSSARRP
jgi:hypothetical protein